MWQDKHHNFNFYHFIIFYVRYVLCVRTIAHSHDLLYTDTLSQMRNCPLPLPPPSGTKKPRKKIGQVTGFLLLLRRGKGKPGTGAVLKLGKVGGNRGKPWSFAVRTLALCSFNFDEYLTGVQFVELKQVFSQVPEIMCEPNMAAVVWPSKYPRKLVKVPKS